MLSMMSASTVDAAVERTCVGNTHGPHRPVSAIGRGRRGRWWRAAAWTAAAGAALRNASERSLTLFFTIVFNLYIALVDAWCCQATLHGPERLHMAGRYLCASAVRV